MFLHEKEYDEDEAKLRINSAPITYSYLVYSTFILHL